MKKYKKTYIEITNACNLACEFCPKTKRAVQFMSRELFEEILVKIKGNSEYLYFHVMGEPLLHPEISTFLDLCLKYGYRVNITTNGTLIDKIGETIAFKPALRQVNFSLHSFEANRNACSMENYLDTVFEFISRSREINSGLLICLRLWNLGEEGRNKENSYVLRRIENEFNLDYTLDNKLTQCRGIKLAENIFLNQAEVFDWPDNDLEAIDCDGFCYGLRDQVAILVDGTVVPCCLDSEGIINLGNIRNEQNLDIILQGERARELYEGFSRRSVVEPLCRKCGYRKRFSQ